MQYTGKLYGTIDGRRFFPLKMSSGEVDAAVADRDQLRAALTALKKGSCWCDVAIGNPMYQGEHTKGCLLAQKVMGE